MKKRILSIILCMFLLFGLTACGEGYKPLQKSFNKKTTASFPSEDKELVKNDKYTLIYDSATASVKLADNETGTLWEVCPTPTKEPELDELGLPALRHGFPQSAIEVGYMDPNINGGGNQSVTTFDSVIDVGRIVLKEIKNGVTLEYYFESQEFMIPVNYVLHDDYLSISVDTAKIQENSYKITHITLTPFLCSVENDATDSYMFYPSGSGALVDTKSINDQGIVYNAYVYGDDLTMEEQFIPTNETSIRMPVYGYKSGEKGGFAIIDSGADTALLTATSGNTGYGFSAIYPEFQIRGYTPHRAKTFNNEYTANIYPTNMIEETVSVRFYPLSGEKANYNSMADIYRDYLVDDCGLKENDDEKALSVNLLGGTMITKSFLGIPYQTLYPTTTVKDASDIVTEISKDVDNLAVKLKGFGATGIDIGKIGGNFKIGDKIGSAKDIKNLSALCKDNKVDLYMDYDLVKFNGTGAGFSYFSDVVMNSGSIRSEQFIIDKAMRNNEEKMSYRLLKPAKFNDAVLKATDKNADLNLTGISFDTLSSLSYSDYSDYNETVRYNAKQGFSDAVSKALANVKKDKQKYMANSANAYAALNADIITDAPISSDNGHTFTENVPFYAMVFKGYVPMTCESINTAADTKRTLLGAVEGGMGLNYTLISNWDNSLIDALYPSFYSTVYSGVKDSMLNTYKDLADYYDSINGAKISSNEILSEGVHSTTFDNGVTVFVNYNTNAVETPAGKVPALGYIVSGGAK
ncbi:MAG: DUF5696 domain-containing protein [Clostridia bacterium]|nr:DUF5696 domain-containing protein [Clostridia bacterium]